MQSTLQPNPRKRALSLSISDGASGSQAVRRSREHYEVPGSNRIHVDSTPTEEPLESAIPDWQLTAARGHDYGPSTVHDNGVLQNGDNFYQAGPASQIFGPSILNGDMRVQLSNAFYSCNHNLPRRSPEEDQERALKSLLYYTTMDDRKAQLERVRPASLEWVWTTQLPQWLESGNSIFWISGKPASGKSTLMHHLAIDKHGIDQVLRHLKTNGSDWILVHFYFDFRAGEGIANTGLGMLRSLLLQLIDQSSKIKDHVLSRCKHRLDGRWPELESELLDLICGAVSSTGVSVCGFIDGLDEYKGHLGKLVALLQEVQERTSSKLCLASRPEPELRYHLHECPSFAMQDYNHGTIAAYIEAATVGMNKFVHSQQLRDVITEIVMNNANGVILWAVFAVDEAIKASLCGCTLAETRKRLELFPQELFAVYGRIWNSLTVEDQQLAAVMFFVIEKWDSSFDRTVGSIALSSCHFTVLTRSIIQRLDTNFKADPDYTELNFRLKAHALLSGLIEGFGESNNVRLAHKSVQSFLHRSPVYIEWTSRIAEVVNADVLGPRFFIDVTLVVCDTLIPESASFWRTVQDLGDKPLLYRFLNHVTSHLEKLSRRKPLDCVTETLHCAREYIAYVGSNGFDLRHPPYFHLLDQASLTGLVVSVSQSWLIRDYMIPFYLYTSRELGSLYFPRYAGLEVLEEKLSVTTEGQSRIDTSGCFNDHPELLYLSRYALSHAFTAILNTGEGLSKSDCEVLFRNVLAEWRRVPGFHRETEARKRIVTLILDQLPWQARFATLISYPAVVDTADIIKENGQCEAFVVKSSLWWPSKDIHTLCLWAWTGGLEVYQHDSLEALLDAGVSLGDDVSEEGNVLHALFAYNPWLLVRSMDEWRFPGYPINDLMPISLSPYGHFSKSKFMAAVSKGADMHACGRKGTVRQAAESLIASMEAVPDKGKEYWQKAVAEVKEVIAYIDSAPILSGTNGSSRSIVSL